MALVQRSGTRIYPDPTRLITRPFLPDTTNFGGSRERLALIVDRILDLPPPVRTGILERERKAAAQWHQDIETSWLLHFDMAAGQMDRLGQIRDEETILVIGAYLTQSYAYEAVSLTNPSIVPFPTVDDERQRFVMSARAIGEGHISSIAFLTGEVTADGELRFDARAPYPKLGDRTRPVYDSKTFTRRLTEVGLSAKVVEKIFEHLPDRFTSGDLEGVLSRITTADLDPNLIADAVKTVHWLAESNYELGFPGEYPISQRVLAPAAPPESGGLEDARLVRFVEDDGGVSYYATYSAFDGRHVLPQLIQTPDFTDFRIATMGGPMASHKGLALFPRRIEGEYAALSRHDNESIFLLRSDDVRYWGTAEVITRPVTDWETIQTGNCGSPLETEAGWLVITHGVGPMRRYVIGALLLDLDEPTKVIGRLREPLLEPIDEESAGLVPNVVYSCGSMTHAGNLILPYGFADHGLGVAVGTVDDVLEAME